MSLFRLRMQTPRFTRRSDSVIGCWNSLGMRKHSQLAAVVWPSLPQSVPNGSTIWGGRSPLSLAIPLG
eukprot:1775931-Amphidinium_carterae.1